MDQAEDQARPCPECGATMQIRDDDGLVLDECPEHGLWFDVGEYDRAAGREVARSSRGLQHGRRRAYRQGYERGSGSVGRPRVSWRDLFTIGRQKDVSDRLRELRKRRRPRVPRNDPPPPAPAAPAPPPPLRHDRPARPCPVCSDAMSRETWRDMWDRTEPVTVDVCSEDGLWLDRGELEVLMKRVKGDTRREGRTKRSTSRQRGFEEGLEHRNTHGDRDHWPGGI